MSDERNDGWPAFPYVDAENEVSYSGMSLRDWFAGQALIGALITAQIIDATTPNIDPAEIGESARDAYRIADEMLKARQP